MTALACFGDSLVYGFPFSSDYSWTAVLEKKYGIKIINEGVCGATTDDILDNMRYTPLPEGVKNVLFFGGANDVIQGCPVKATLDTIERVKRLAAEKGWKLCLVLPLLSGEYLANQKIHTLREELGKQSGVFILDLQPAVGIREDELRKAYIDGWHPKAGVYEKMGEYAGPILTEWLGMDAEKSSVS
ncbi:MAG: GDSL-type esterase/lipase family protein [Selenomonadaceae bacterium]|nr:GDSL-type esterase/lipase family protein [Selenomonadaceae bacterium]